MQTFSTKHPVESFVITGGFAHLLVPGETISSASITVTVLHGADPSPAAMLSGSTAVSGTDVLQRIQGGIDGVDYQLTFTAQTNLGNTYSVAGLLPVRVPK